MDRNKNSIQMGYQCKNPFVCCLFIFYIFVSRSFPLPSAFLSTDIERGKVFGQNTLRRRKIQSETVCRPDLSTFKGYCTTFADEQQKWVNGGIGKLIISQIDDRPYSNNHAHTMKSSPPFCPFIKKLYLCCKELSHWCKTIKNSKIGMVAECVYFECTLASLPILPTSLP